jgi:hypothetical protein
MRNRIRSNEKVTELTLISESLEEALALQILWCNKSEIVSFNGQPDGNVELEIATTED